MRVIESLMVPPHVDVVEKADMTVKCRLNRVVDGIAFVKDGQPGIRNRSERVRQRAGELWTLWSDFETKDKCKQQW